MKAFLKTGFTEPNASQKRTGPRAWSLTSSRAGCKRQICPLFCGRWTLYTSYLGNNMSTVLKEFTLVTDKEEGKGDAGGIFMMGAKSVSKKYLLLSIGYRQQS